MTTSYFSNIDDVIPKEFDLDKWLEYTISPPDKYKRAVDKYRETFDTHYKSELPCITISSKLTKYRSSENIEQKLPFISLDIDRFSKKNKKPSNVCIDMQLVKEMFESHPSTYYCGFSCSGDGVYAIMKLADVNKLKEYFEYFRDRLSHVGINIDSSCKDYTRLRYFSYDEEAYYNKDARPLFLPKKKVYKPVNINSTTYKNDLDKVEAVVKIIETHGIDITGDYDEWCNVGAVLFNFFGDVTGRSLFHRISCFYSDYSYKDCDKKFDSLRKMKKIDNLGVLFNLCTPYGIRY